MLEDKCDPFGSFFHPIKLQQLPDPQMTRREKNGVWKTTLQQRANARLKLKRQLEKEEKERLEKLAEEE